MTIERGVTGDALFVAGMIAVFAVPFLVYLTGVILGRITVPAETRGGRHLFGAVVIGFYYWLIAPILRACLRLRVTPNQVSIVSLVLSIVGGAAIALGHFEIAATFVIAGGSLDMIDGQIARARNLATPGGAFLDSVSDRIADGAVFGGCVIYYQGTWMAYVALATLVAMFCVSYSRARGEALGVSGAGGLMQRGDRLALLGIALAFSPLVAHGYESYPLHPTYAVTAVTLCMIAGLSVFTFVTRTLFTLRALGRERTESKAPVVVETLRIAKR
jgi:CDP-diacylglycerol--glycerol-3-phosphate 3-phosphatidyltransferase